MTKKQKPQDRTKIFRLECMGLDEILEFTYPDFNDGDDYDIFFIGHYIPSFYSHQQPFRNYFRRMFKMMWCAIANKDYFFYEISMTKKQFKEFKTWVRGL